MSKAHGKLILITALTFLISPFLSLPVDSKPSSKFKSNSNSNLNPNPSEGAIKNERKISQAQYTNNNNNKNKNYNEWTARRISRWEENYSPFPPLSIGILYNARTDNYPGVSVFTDKSLWPRNQFKNTKQNGSPFYVQGAEPRTKIWTKYIQNKGQDEGNPETSRSNLWTMPVDSRVKSELEKIKQSSSSTSSFFYLIVQEFQTKSHMFYPGKFQLRDISLDILRENEAKGQDGATHIVTGIIMGSRISAILEFDGKVAEADLNGDLSMTTWTRWSCKRKMRGNSANLRSIKIFSDVPLTDEGATLTPFGKSKKLQQYFYQPSEQFDVEKCQVRQFFDQFLGPMADLHRNSGNFPLYSFLFPIFKTDANSLQAKFEMTVYENNWTFQIQKQGNSTNHKTKTKDDWEQVRTMVESRLEKMSRVNEIAVLFKKNVITPHLDCLSDLTVEKFDELYTTFRAQNQGALENLFASLNSGFFNNSRLDSELAALNSDEAMNQSLNFMDKKLGIREHIENHIRLWTQIQRQRQSHRQIQGHSIMYLGRGSDLNEQIGKWGFDSQENSTALFFTNPSLDPNSLGHESVQAFFNLHLNEERKEKSERRFVVNCEFHADSEFCQEAKNHEDNKGANGETFLIVNFQDSLQEEKL